MSWFRSETLRASPSSSIAASAPLIRTRGRRCRGGFPRSRARCVLLARLTSGVDCLEAEALTPPPLHKEEFERMWRVLDMAITGHSILRDRYRRRVKAITLTIMGLSIAAVSLAFANANSRVALIGIEAELVTWVGVLSAVIFFLALLDALVDWKRSAWAHEDAALRLSELKSSFRSATISNGVVDTEHAHLRADYEAIMQNVAVIPESSFLSLKAKHRRKVALSRAIDDSPGAPLTYVRLLTYWRGMRPRAPKSGGTEPIEETPS